MLILGAGESEQDPAIGWNTPSPKLAFADVYTSEGYVLTSIMCEIISTDDVVISTIITSNPIAVAHDDFPGPAFIIPIRADMEVLPNEAVYYARAKITDSNGNTSEWSPKLWFRKNWRTLPPPTGCVLLRN